MSVPNLEEPLERLNYFNSQRLEAVDFRLEQLYHIRVRRWLNKSLYSPGIAAGLEVQKNPNDSHSVIVSPGLALDIDGREIIVLEERIVKVCGTPRRPDGVRLGNYLVISYGEDKVAPMQDGCRVSVAKPTSAASCNCRGSTKSRKSGDCGCGGTGNGGSCSCGSSNSASRELSWGAPSRIRSEPLLLFQDAWPSDTQRKILLAQVVLNEQCQVEDIKSGMRRYATATKPPNTTPISIEGEKDIDAANPKNLRFHIEGGFPDTATLYLQGAQLSTLFYTELGRHGHALSISLSSTGATAAHQHSLDSVATSTQPGHSHTIEANTEDSGNALELHGKDQRSNLNTTVELTVSNAGEHSHSFAAGTMTGLAGAGAGHTHTVTASLAQTGVTNRNADDNRPMLTFVDSLHVDFDGNDVTAQIIAQLQALNPAWTQLGDGSNTHEFVKNGTGPIDLRQLGVDLSPGAHVLTFRVGSGGGKVLYNLYVS